MFLTIYTVYTRRHARTNDKAPYSDDMVIWAAARVLIQLALCIFFFASPQIMYSDHTEMALGLEAEDAER